MDHGAGIVAAAGPLGLSLFTTRPFKQNELLFVIAGPVTTLQDLYTVPITRDLTINPTPQGNYARWLNHSCEPAAGIWARTMVVAMRDLATGEEVTIDYAMIVDEYGDEATEADLICRCASPACRGRLGAYDRLPPHLRERYRGYISEYLVPEGRGAGGPAPFPV